MRNSRKCSCGDARRAVSRADGSPSFSKCLLSAHGVRACIPGAPRRFRRARGSHLWSAVATRAFHARLQSLRLFPQLFGRYTGRSARELLRSAEGVSLQARSTHVQPLSTPSLPIFRFHPRDLQHACSAITYAARASVSTLQAGMAVLRRAAASRSHTLAFRLYSNSPTDASRHSPRAVLHRASISSRDLSPGLASRST
ncbi:hypothetical protein BV25DRAFT_764241 [Artomyces pyxidatus]|uniref:Uncharacterized protein n=1 Tax=Artomyces pyxidatus TaxID=48021 RepID=A0ACB8T079_9AGAM|nr:hypothetical protein BV25DRAFT_764241 [Artomyces pyxidatus]